MKLPKLEDKQSIINWLKQRTEYTSVGCWIYHGGSRSPSGHTSIKVSGRRVYLQRLSAYIYLNLSLDDLHLQANHKHECLNKTCWNPEHIYVGTHQGNMADAKVLGQFHNQKKTHCIHGHELSAVNVLMVNGKRQCRPCQTERMRLRRRNNKCQITA